jgi:predicted PurR-regulated permease PerM
VGRRAGVDEAPPNEQPAGDIIERHDITAKPPPRVPAGEPPGRGAGQSSLRQRPGRRPGVPFDRRNPFLVGFLAALGALLSIALGAVIYSIRGTLVLVFLALFIAVGLEGVVSFLVRHGVRRQLAVLFVVFAAACVVAAFVYSAISPIQHEFHQLSTHVPFWRHEIATGKGTIGHIARDLHLTYYLSKTGSSTLTGTLESGAIGAGKKVLTAVSSLLVVVVLTIYFLAAWPSIKRFFVQLVPESRRRRFSLLLDDVTAGVGGFLLGNISTSLVAGLGTYLWATAFGIPYSILLALLVALFDLVPVVGSTVAGVVVSLVALAVSVPVAIGTAAFYVLYRFVEDYLLVPRVMRHAVNVSPALTVLATIVGGALLGIIGALVAIPVAAGIKLVVEESVFPRLDRS